MTLSLFEEKTFSPDETVLCGRKLAKMIEKNGLPGFICLSGDLGTGKTEFTRGIASWFSPASKVRSPSFTIVNEYRRGTRPVFHFDVYRIDGDDDLVSSGFFDYPEEGVFVVEWAEKIASSLPPDRIEVTISRNGDENSRLIKANLITRKAGISE